MNKHQNILFFLGAGFSAPFGLPVMGNFIDKSKDLYFSDEEKYKQINQTLELINKYSKVKNYMNVDLYNIEDLLSITYMEAVINKNRKPLTNITTFIKTVIEAYTNESSDDLLLFIELISNLKLEKTNRVHFRKNNTIPEIIPTGRKNKNTSFGIITLNYDLILENGISKYLELMSQYYYYTKYDNPIEKYIRPTNTQDNDGIQIAKLHGSVNKNIIPPTWNKTINNEIHNDWLLATKLIKEATHIIFLGYSLPITDTYIKFLFSSSLNSNQKLKRISAITLDKDSLTKSRYSKLFSMNFHFHNSNLESFFKFLKELVNRDYDFDSFDADFSNLN